MHLLNNLTINARVLLIGVVSLVVVLVVAALGYRASHHAEASLHHLYDQRLIVTHDFASADEHVLEALTEILLSLQHAPNSPTLALHDHAESKHLESAKQHLQKAAAAADDALKHVKGTPEEQLVEQFVARLGLITSSVLGPIIKDIENSEFDKASHAVVSKAVPEIKALVETGEAVMTDLSAKAEAEYHEQLELDQATELEKLVVILFGVVLIGGVIFAVRKSLADAIGTIEDISTRLQKGDLTARCDYLNKDELGRVCGSLNAIGESFAAMICQINDAITQLASAAEETSVITKENGDRINHQFAETEQVATAMTEMASTIQEIARTATVADEAAVQTDKNAKIGNKTATQAVASTEQLVTKIQESSSAILRLDEASDNIGSVLDVIRGIAEQTNLLALNAAIEAARAGEQGRGFAVVADEVRTLAGRTQDSTKEIQEMIEELQMSARLSTTTMKAGHVEAEKTLEQVLLAGKALEDITQAAAHIRDMNTQIATAVEEQGAVAEDVNRNLTAIRDLGAATSDGASQIAEANTQQARVASELQVTASKFIV